MKILSYILLLLFCWSCTHSETEKVQHKRGNIVNVREWVKEIAMEDVLIGGSSQLHIADDYLIIGDYRAFDKMIHIFNKNTFSHINSMVNKGQGPGEIANLGHIEFNKNERLLYVTDHGKQCIFSYPLDSILVNSDYLPEVRMKMSESQFPSRYHYINDTLSIGLIIEPIGNYGFNQSLGMWNMKTGTVEKMKYTHPEIEKKRVCFAVSEKDGIYIECYHYHDLMTICNMDGNLKYNIYGSLWNNEKSNKKSYYNNVTFCDNKIVAHYYSGMDTFSTGKSGEIQSNFSTQLIVFDRNGDYIKTLETGLRIVGFCYDSDNNRLILNFDDEIQFGYLDIEGL